MRLDKLVKSKTFWTGLGILGHSIYLLTTGQHEQGIMELALALQTIFLRDSIAKIEEK